MDEFTAGAYGLEYLVVEGVRLLMCSKSLWCIALLCIAFVMITAGCQQRQHRVNEGIEAIHNCPQDEFRTDSEHYDISPAVKVVFDQKVSQRTMTHPCLETGRLNPTDQLSRLRKGI